MNNPLLLALPLACGFALADTSPTPSSTAEDAYEIVVVDAASASTKRAQREARELRERPLYHSPLNSILTFVHDRATADAAVPRVKELLAAAGDAKPQLPENTWLHLYFGHQCHGSTELMAALRTCLPPKLENAERYRAAMAPTVQAIADHLDALAATVEQVKDDETEATALKALQELPAALDRITRQAHAAAAELRDLPLQEEVHPFLRAATNVGHCAAADRLMHAHAHVQKRNLLQSRKELHRAMMKVWMELEGRLGSAYFFDPPTSLRKVPQSERHAAAIREWLERTASIHDKTSADAAADWLEKRSKKLGTPLTYVSPRVSSCHCLCIMSYAEHMKTIRRWLEYATPAFYGSEKLKSLLQWEPEED